jgi:NAD(P)-dependent dehydrogenase (short-subunit alcohol dehydrogenase family)
LNRVKDDLTAIGTSCGKDIKVLIHAGDVSKPETSQNLKDLVEAECGGRLDCLVCNAGAGVSGKAVWAKHIHETFIAGYEYATNLNYLASHYAAKNLIPLMLNPQSVGRTLISVCSGAAHLTHMHPHAYAIAKLALTRMTQDIGENYVDEGLTAIAMHPGSVMTPGTVAGTEGVAEMTTASKSHNDVWIESRMLKNQCVLMILDSVELCVFNYRKATTLGCLVDMSRRIGTWMSWRL